MTISMFTNHPGGSEESARQVADLEQAGLDMAIIPKARDRRLAVSDT